MIVECYICGLSFGEFGIVELRYGSRVCLHCLRRHVDDWNDEPTRPDAEAPTEADAIRAPY